MYLCGVSALRMRSEQENARLIAHVSVRRVRVAQENAWDGGESPGLLWGSLK